MPSSAPSEGPPRAVLVDANGWLLPFRSGLRLREEVDRLLPGVTLIATDSVLRELRSLRRRGVEWSAAALALAEAAGRLRSRGAGDDAILEVAVRRRLAVLTADRGLAGRLRRAGIHVLVPRDRTRLELRAGLTPRLRATVISGGPVLSGRRPRRTRR